MSDPRILTVRPEPGEYAWTFGGAPPVARIAPGTVLDLYTEDCFGGRVRSEKDLVSEVCEFPYLNPQTGPFHIEGAEPGDTVAVHFVSIEPARDWAASTTVPLFGALTSTHTTATLQPPLPEIFSQPQKTCREQQTHCTGHVEHQHPETPATRLQIHGRDEPSANPK